MRKVDGERPGSGAAGMTEPASGKSATAVAGPAEPPRDRALPMWLWAGGLVVIVLALLLVFARG